MTSDCWPSTDKILWICNLPMNMEDILEFGENEIFWLRTNNTHRLHNIHGTPINATKLLRNFNNTDHFLHGSSGGSGSGVANDLTIHDACQSIDPKTKLNYWNVTCDAPIDYVVPLYGYCMPFLLVITVLANSLIVVILRRKNMNSPTNFVLMGKIMGINNNKSLLQSFNLSYTVVSYFMRHRYGNLRYVHYPISGTWFLVYVHLRQSL